MTLKPHRGNTMMTQAWAGMSPFTAKLVYEDLGLGQYFPPRSLSTPRGLIFNIKKNY